MAKTTGKRPKPPDWLVYVIPGAQLADQASPSRLAVLEILNAEHEAACTSVTGPPVARFKTARAAREFALRRQAMVETWAIDWRSTVQKAARGSPLPRVH